MKYEGEYVVMARLGGPASGAARPVRGADDKVKLYVTREAAEEHARVLRDSVSPYSVSRPHYYAAPAGSYARRGR